MINDRWYCECGHRTRKDPCPRCKRPKPQAEIESVVEDREDLEFIPQPERREIKHEIPIGEPVPIQDGFDVRDMASIKPVLDEIRDQDRLRLGWERVGRMFRDWKALVEDDRERVKLETCPACGQMALLIRRADGAWCQQCLPR